MKLGDLLKKVERVEPPKTLEEILTMPLSEFKKAGLLVRVRCGNLNGDDIFIASTDREAETGLAEGLITYTADELVELCKGKPDPDTMRQIHEAKKILQGTLIEAEEGRGSNAIN